MSSNSNENIAPAVMRRLMKEIAQLIHTPPEGIKVSIPDESDCTEIHAFISGPHETPFAGGVFQMKLQLGAEFPQAPPKGFFLTKIFHPNVSSAGEICVNTLKRDWKETHGIEHILLTIKCLLIVPNPKSALNEEAGRLLLEDYDGYFKKAKLWTSIYAPLDPAYQDLSQASGSSSSSSSSTSQPRQAKKVTSTAQKAKRNLKRL